MAKKRSRTRQARQRRQQQRRRDRRSLIILAIVIVAVVAVAMLIVSSQPVDAFIPTDLQQRYEGITRSFSPEGYPQLGDQNAPVTVDEFSSFACPGCETVHSESFDALLDRVRAGQILFSFVPLQTGSIPNASGAARAALCAGRQGMFWEMHDVLFDWQTRYANTAYSQPRLLAGVAALGLDETSFTNCFNSAAISETLASAMNEDVTGTPTINVNGVTLTSQRAGGIPTAAEILQAIDLATPDDWRIDAEAVETPAEEPSPSDQAEELDIDNEPEEPDAEDDESSADDDATAVADSPETDEASPAEVSETAEVAESVDQADSAADEATEVPSEVAPEDDEAESSSE